MKIKDLITKTSRKKPSSVVSVRLDLDDIRILELISQSTNLEFSLLIKEAIKEFIENSTNEDLTISRKKLLNYKSRLDKTKNGKMTIENVVTNVLRRIKFIQNNKEFDEIPILWFIEKSSNEFSNKKIDLLNAKYTKYIEEENHLK